jgi:hypothetical protein
MVNTEILLHTDDTSMLVTGPTPCKYPVMILHTDDTSMLVTGPTPYKYPVMMKEIFLDTISWFKANLLSLDLEGKLIGYNLV